MIYHYKLVGSPILIFCAACALSVSAENLAAIDEQVSCGIKTETSASENKTAENRQENGSEDKNKPDAVAARSVQIRVLLDVAYDDESHPGWRIMAKKGFILLNQHEPGNSTFFDSEMVMLHQNNGSWYLDNKKIQTDRLLIRAQEGSLMVDGVPYYGSLYIAIEPGKLLLINCLDLEDYVLSVIAAEGLPGWPLEMNKVQAIAVRTYAASMICKNAGKKCLYHIKNTNVHQCYKGKPNSGPLRAAVDQTRGIILTYDNEPIIAMYDICCGGVIPANMRGIDFKIAPYLARTAACTFCKDVKNYRWQISYPRKDLEASLKEQLPRLGKLRTTSVSRKDKAGLVREVEIMGSGGVFHLKGHKLYAVVKRLRSLCFTIEADARRITFKGRGYGHLTGLCQSGAHRMISQGADYKRVLHFYYPGTHFMKIKERIA